MIKATNLTIEYKKLLFENLSFTLGNREKVGLIGLNGCGKSTLLKILAGVEEPDAGSITYEKETVAYLPQEYELPQGIMVGEFLENLVDDHYSEMHKVDTILSKLEFQDVDIYQTVETLSHGQKMKLYLTQLLIDEPTVLLLDEPTNHLDIYGILWLEKFLSNFKGICIIVSHDRAFLNSVITKVFEIDERKLNIFEGNYDDYLDQKQELIEKRRNQFHLQEKKKEKFEQMIVRIKTKMAGGEKQSRALQAARNRMNREVMRNEVTLYEDKKIKDLNLIGENHSRKLVLEVKDLDFGFGEKEIFKSAELEIYGKEKVWLYGANGAGKTTLVKLILGELNPQNGTIKLGANLNFAYFSQDQSHISTDETVEQYFLSRTSVSYSHSFKALDKFLFDKEMRNMPVRKLSPGQKARLSFAVFAQGSYDFLILDEPTNHLDIKSKEVIEDALSKYQGAILMISHDRYFVENVGMDREVGIENGEIIG